MIEHVHAVLLEDDPNDLELARRLTKAGLRCHPLPPPERLEDVVDAIQKMLPPDAHPIVLMDYRLDDVRQAYGHTASYRGGTAAAYVREELEAVPLVLVTTEARWHRWVEGSPSLEGLFDHTVLKENLARLADRRQIALQLSSIAVAFSTISTEWPGRLQWQHVAGWMEAGDSSDLMERAGNSSLPRSRAATGRWLLNTILGLPGLVVDKADAAAMLGVEESSFSRDPIAGFAGPARYTGLFSGARERWWRASLLGLVRDLEVDGPSEETARAIAGHLNTDLRTVRSAKCIWCGEADVDRACCVCRRPVGTNHAVPGERPTRPNWALPDLVCFDCLESGRADDIQLSASYRRIAAKVRSGEARARE